MITQEEAIKATNLIFEFCCQQMDCKSCPFRGNGFLYQSRGIKLVDCTKNLVRGIEFGMEESDNGLFRNSNRWNFIDNWLSLCRD